VVVAVSPHHLELIGQVWSTFFFFFFFFFSSGFVCSFGFTQTAIFLFLFLALVLVLFVCFFPSCFLFRRC
jgi:hypothetical protein